MKRSEVVMTGVVLVLVSAAPARAQDLRIGMQIGLSVSSFHPGHLEVSDGTPALDEHRTGLVAGATVAYRLGVRAEVESGLLWVQKGARGALQGFEEPIATDVRMSYLQVPLLIRVTPLPDLPVRMSVAAGPALSFETRCAMEQDVSPVAVVVGCQDEHATTDVGLLLGAGFAWTLGTAELMLEARYDLGLRDIDTAGYLDTHNRGFMLAPRVSIPLGG